MIEQFRKRFNLQFDESSYAELLKELEAVCGTRAEFRVAETPVFIPLPLLEEMACAGEALLLSLLADRAYLQAAAMAIPSGFRVANQTRHPHFLTADFALIRTEQGELEPRLVEIQAFPSVFGFQSVLCKAYRSTFGLGEDLNCYFPELNEDSYWELLKKTIAGDHEAENVVLLEVDPKSQKTLPDFLITARKLGIAVVDIATLESGGSRLFYRNEKGRRVLIERIYNRAIADELIRRSMQLPFDLEYPWEVEWAGHPNWYFLVSKYSLPWLTKKRDGARVVPPAVFLDEFLEGDGAKQFEARGVELPRNGGWDSKYPNLLLKPLFSFAGKGIEFEPTRSRLESIPRAERSGYLLQERMNFEPTIETPYGLTQAEVRILYVWPDSGKLTAVLPLVRLGRGRMMGVDHNRNLQWVGASAAFFPGVRGAL